MAREISLDQGAAIVTTNEPFYRDPERFASSRWQQMLGDMLCTAGEWMVDLSARLEQNSILPLGDQMVVIEAQQERNRGR